MQAMDFIMLSENIAPYFIQPVPATEGLFYSNISIDRAKTTGRIDWCSSRSAWMPVCFLSNRGRIVSRYIPSRSDVVNDLCLISQSKVFIRHGT